MEFAMIGLGRMGSNMVRRLVRGGHSAVVYDVDPAQSKALEKEGALSAPSLTRLLAQVSHPAVLWLMLPAGDVTEQTLRELEPMLQAGDLVIDGGNSHFKDDVRRAKRLHARGALYLDAGVSGGVWGLEKGYCLMAGGEKEAFVRAEPLLRTLAPGPAGIPPSPSRAPGTAEQGYVHCGPAGSGHFVKMVHNGIEYGMMQALAEGLELLHESSRERVPSEHRFDLNLAEISETWRRGSVITSWLLDLAARSLNQDQDLAQFHGRVEDSGEGRWMLEAAMEAAVPVPALAAAIFTRFRSRESESYAEKLLSAMRNGFGGHGEARLEPDHAA